MVQIKFKTKENHIRGFYELATKARGRSLPDGIFEISEEYLRMLDDANLAYEIISREAR